MKRDVKTKISSAMVSKGARVLRESGLLWHEASAEQIVRKILEVVLSGQRVTADISLTCDAGPLLFFIESFRRAFELAQKPFELSDLTFELARSERNPLATGASEVGVTLYPSDAFLSFAATRGSVNGAKCNDHLPR